MKEKQSLSSGIYADGLRKESWTPLSVDLVACTKSLRKFEDKIVQ
jgi:hypothetical protein